MRFAQPGSDFERNLKTHNRQKVQGGPSAGEEEMDESLFFLEMIVEFNKDKRDKIAILYKEGEEILKIVAASLKTLRKK